MMLEETIRILSMQEEILQFPHFTNKDAWELGSYMVSEAAHNGLPVVISIRLWIHPIPVWIQRNQLL